jgi:methylated-DNA-[protein]-cysteine S-methyltransferase
MSTPFREKVYTILKTVPKGKVVTYGQLAKMAGSPGAARAVGMCMKENPHAPIVPCHRVVAADGKLTGYSGKNGVKGKMQMLKDEGVFFVNDRVDLDKSQWHTKQ